MTISSQAHRTGRINFGDLQSERHYQRWIAYGQSKLANLLFMMELQRRLDAAGSPLRSVAAHPGYSATNLQSHTQSFQDQIMGVFNHVIAQSAAMGALPTLYAATAGRPGRRLRRARTACSSSAATRSSWTCRARRRTRTPRAGCGRSARS